MASSLPYELLTIIFYEYADDLSTLHSCILVNRSWCMVGLQYLWAKPFTLLLSSQKERFYQSAENLVTTFIECFTDVDSLENALQLCKKNSKKFPFDYTLYLKEIYFEEIQALIIWCSKFNLTKMSVSITCLAVAHCPNLTTLSLSIYSLYLVPFSINEGWTLPHLQNLSLPLHFDNSISSTLSRIVHNLESISVEDLGYAFFNFAKQEPFALPHPGLQKLIQSQHQLKTITMKHVTIKMSSLF